MRFRKKGNSIVKSSDIKARGPIIDDSLRGHRLVFRVVLSAALIFGITFLYPIDKVYLPIDVPPAGELATKDIVAPFDFPILKTDEELRRDRELVISSLRPIVAYDTIMSRAIVEGAERFFERVDSLVAADRDSVTFMNQIKGEYPAIPESLLAVFRNSRALRSIRNFCLSAIDTVVARGVIPKLDDLPHVESGLVLMEIDDTTRTIPRETLFDIEKAQEYLLLQAGVRFGDSAELRKAAVYVAEHFLKANVEYDREATEKRRKDELQGIEREKGLVQAGEKIIRANERVTDQQREKLISLARYKRKHMSQTNFWRFLLPPLGRLFFVAFPILFFGFYIYNFRRHIFGSNSALILFAILFAGMVIILNIIVSQEYLSPYLVPLTIASMLVTIAYDLETGLFLTFSICLLAGILSGFRLDVAFVGIAAGTVASFSVRKVRHRHEFYRSILYISVVYFGVVYIIESLKLTPSADLWRHTGLAVLNGFLSPVLTIGLLPLFETTFKLTTDITLLELSDLNRPLLKRLALEAPGTYNHSIMIGTLAEEAAKAIEANSLLARVGSYYHDIGKMLKPEYFVENQMGAENKHEKLAPSMSALILEAHVKEGKELAEEHGLPDCIIEFITGHHGTSTMTYFYEKARQLQGDEEVNVDEFRYPGPKPKSKEVAIVMLADSVEAASRTLEDPTPARVRNLVRRIISAKFDSGELEDCDLTLMELHRIEESFTRVLLGIHHRRIEYPEKEEEKAEI
jgi:putative nucleotidyltransferase with HDIG domain